MKNKENVELIYSTPNEKQWKVSDGDYHATTVKVKNVGKTEVIVTFESFGDLYKREYKKINDSWIQFDCTAYLSNRLFNIETGKLSDYVLKHNSMDENKRFALVKHAHENYYIIYDKEKKTLIDVKLYDVYDQRFDNKIVFAIEKNGASTTFNLETGKFNDYTFRSIYRHDINTFGWVPVSGCNKCFLYNVLTDKFFEGFEFENHEDVTLFTNKFKLEKSKDLISQIKSELITNPELFKSLPPSVFMKKNDKILSDLITTLRDACRDKFDKAENVGDFLAAEEYKDITLSTVHDKLEDERKKIAISTYLKDYKDAAKMSTYRDFDKLK